MSKLNKLRRTFTVRRPLMGRKPKVFFCESVNNLNIVSMLHQLHQNFVPTPWLYNTHVQLIFHGLRKNLRTQRRLASTLYDHYDDLVMRDGGRTALLWCGYNLAPSIPTIVVLHTITGSPDSMAELVHDLHVHTGWRIVLCLRRGHADLPLVTTRLNILGCTDDLREQLSVIRARFPESPLYGVGSSAGSGLLARYLGEEGEAAPFHAAFAYCPGYDTNVGFDRALPFYSRMMGKKLVRQFITPNLELLKHLPTVAYLQLATDLGEFHRNLYELAGYDSYEAYDQASNPMYVFHAIRTPLMLLNSEDDPVCDISNLEPWLPRIRQMPNVILVTTSEGSHCAHYEGWLARSWSARLMGSYFQAIHNQSD